MTANYMAIPGLKYPIDEWKRKPVDQPECIIDAVCNGFKLTREMLFKKDRHKYFVRARFVCFYMLKTDAGMTFKNIGIMFNRDHTSILHGVRFMKGQLSLNHHTQAKTDIDYIKFLL